MSMEQHLVCIAGFLALYCLCVVASESPTSSQSPTVATPTAPFRIIGYTPTFVYASSRPSVVVPTWAKYDIQERSNRTRSSASNTDDNVMFDLVDDSNTDRPFTAPFYQMEAASWYVSSNGFLAPLRAAMCSYFCSGGSDISTGYYQVASNLPNGGGDWPGIQFYTCDLDPSGTAEAYGGIYKHILNKSYDDGASHIRVALVEYLNIHLYTDRPETVAGQNLTAQVEIWENGTIIVRYASTLGLSALTMLSIPPGLNLVWTVKQRQLGNLYSSLAARVPMAVRFDPILDTCNRLSSCDTCVAIQSVNGSAGCNWCGALNLCVNASVVADYCAPSELGECALSSVPPAQAFYDQSQLTPNATLDATNSVDVPSDPFFGTNFSFPAPRQLVKGNWSAPSTSDPPFTLQFSNWTNGGRFPIFYDPPTWNYSSGNTRLLDRMYVTRHGTVSFLTNAVACEYLGYCQSGQYNFALLGVATYNVVYIGQTQYEYGAVPVRSVGDYLCGVGAATLNNGTRCPAAVFVHVYELESYWRVTSPTSTAQQWSFVVLLDTAGRMATHYRRRPQPLTTTNGTVVFSPVEPIVAYPKPDFGLYRNGYKDGSSVDIPWSSMTTGTTLVLTPKKTCDDCGSGGVCNRTSFECVCGTGFSGPGCASCDNGYYGSSCTACPNCGTYGSCIDGRSGTGACQCVAPYSGATCNVHCSAPPYECPGCTAPGGYCECGVCICATGRGWSGPNCTTWTDPCRALSLDGCPVCTAYPNITCNYCASNVCVADTSQSGIGIINGTFATCSPYYSQNQSTCVFIAQTTAPQGVLAVVVVVMSFGAIGTIVFCSLTVICTFRRRKPNLLVSRAVTGAPNFHFVKRDREVVQMVRLPIQGRSGKPVQGIPLRQVPIKDLFEQQLTKRAMESQRTIRDWTLLRES